MTTNLIKLQVIKEIPDRWKPEGFEVGHVSEWPPWDDDESWDLINAITLGGNVSGWTAKGLIKSLYHDEYLSEVKP